jgi:hypothetical protein
MIRVRPKDFNGLPVGARNRRFALRKFRFDFSSLGLCRARPSPPFEKSARKKLFESGAKALKSLSGINLCAAFFAAAGAVSASRRRAARASASTKEMSWRRHKPLHGSNSSTIPGSGPIDFPFLATGSAEQARTRLPPSMSANQARLRWKFDDLFKVEGLRRGDGPGRRP